MSFLNLPLSFRLYIYFYLFLFLNGSVFTEAENCRKIIGKKGYLVKSLPLLFIMTIDMDNLWMLTYFPVRDFLMSQNLFISEY